MLKLFGKLPDEVGRQKPIRVFELLEENERPKSYTGSNPYLRMFYGL